MTNLPVAGAFSVTCIYGQKGNLWSSGYHKGIDLVASNRNIYCTCDGVVKTVGFDKSGWGQYIRVQENTTKNIHIFCHLVTDSQKVKVGQKVNRSTILGTMGTTGNSTGVHLHFQIEKSNSNRTVCDPTEWLGIPNKKGSYNSADYQVGADVLKNIKDKATIASWAKTDVEKVVANEIMVGDNNGNFRPNDPITRAEMATVICRGWKNNSIFTKVSPSASKPFKDVAFTAWYYNNVEMCRKAAILRGDENGNCYPEKYISRQDAIVMIMRLKYTDAQIASMNINDVVKKSGVNPVDFNKVSNYAKPYVAAALGTLIKGNEKGEINPQNVITRQEVAAIIVRACKL